MNCAAALRFSNAERQAVVIFLRCLIGGTVQNITVVATR